MKRSEIAHLADIPPKRFDLLAERGHLPFPKRKHGPYTMREALLLRLVAVATSVEGFGGISPADACRLVVDGMGYVACRYNTHEPDVLVGLDHAVWIAGVEFVGETISGSTEIWRGWFAGPLDELTVWSQEQLGPEKPGIDALRSAHVSRVVASLNVSAAARYVLSRAEEIGLSKDKT